MPESKKIWTGTWMGIAAHVEMTGGAPVPFLAGRRARFEADVLGILAAAVVGLAEERDAAQVKPVLLDNAERERLSALLGETATRLFDAGRERDALRGRFAKLEAALSHAVTQLEVANELLLEENVRGEEDGVQDIRDWIHEIRAGLLKDGGRDGETSKV